jgi:hypothetical protein
VRQVRTAGVAAMIEEIKTLLAILILSLVID